LEDGAMEVYYRGQRLPTESLPNRCPENVKGMIEPNTASLCHGSPSRASRVKIILGDEITAT
jgi:hypothetical protein